MHDLVNEMKKQERTLAAIRAERISQTAALIKAANEGDRVELINSARNIQALDHVGDKIAEFLNVESTPSVKESLGLV